VHGVNEVLQLSRASLARGVATPFLGGADLGLGRGGLSHPILT
jgi:hypothetical protein